MHTPIHRGPASVGFLGPKLPVKARMAGDLMTHHRWATPNQADDTRLRQAHIHPRHDRRTIQGSKHPTTPHDQPPNSITATRKLLTPYDTAPASIQNHRHTKSLTPNDTADSATANHKRKSSFTVTLHF